MSGCVNACECCIRLEEANKLKDSATMNADINRNLAQRGADFIKSKGLAAEYLEWSRSHPFSGSAISNTDGGEDE